MRQITLKKKIILSRFSNLSGLVLISLFLLGMSSAPKNAPPISLTEQIRIKVDQALAGLKSAYESENLSDFINLLDKDYEDRLTFQSNLENYFISNKNPEIMIITDAVLINKDKVGVRLHWFKKVMNNAGLFAKLEGSCQFVFLNSGQEFKLLYIRGDNPFF